MRKEIASFERAGSPRSSIRYRAYQLFRKAEFWIIRSTFGRIAVGSAEWHLRQTMLARRSSVGLDLMVRSWFYENSLRACGDRLCVFPDVVMHYPRNIRLGSNVFINRGAMITAPISVSIGNAVLIGPYVVINSGNHRYADPGCNIRDQGHDLKPIVIGSDVWLGAHVTVLAGVTIGRGAVVAAGAVVTQDVEPNAVVAGVPARVIAHRN